MTPADFFKEGVLDASAYGYGKFSTISPRIAKVVCLSCLSGHFSLDGVWGFKTCCVFCRDQLSKHPPSVPIVGTHPNPDLASNPYYMYGFLAGMATRLGVILGKHWKVSEHAELQTKSKVGAYADEPL